MAELARQTNLSLVKTTTRCGVPLHPGRPCPPAASERLACLLRRSTSISPQPPSSCCKQPLEVDTLLAALPLLLPRFRPDLLHVLDVLDGAAVALLFFVFCVCLYVTLVYSLFGWPVCAVPG